MCTKLLKVNSSSVYEGYEKCNRYVSDGLLNRICDGVIDEYDTDTSCTCHTGHPPCSHCVDSRAFCPKCGWDGYEEQCLSTWQINNMSKICNGLINEDYDYHLSGDCLDYCICVVTNKRCIGMTVQDPDDQSSRFFSRGKNIPVESKLKFCPMFGLSVETIQKIVKEKTENDLNEKLNSIGK